jgi:hypothetical protein
VVEVAYVKAKLSELARQGEVSIAAQILSLTGEATKTGNLSSSRYHLFALEELKKGFRIVLKTMSRFLIDANAVSNDRALSDLKLITGNWRHV